MSYILFFRSRFDEKYCNESGSRLQKINWRHLLSNNSLSYFSIFIRSMKIQDTACAYIQDWDTRYRSNGMNILMTVSHLAGNDPEFSSTVLSYRNYDESFGAQERILWILTKSNLSIPLQFLTHSVRHWAHLEEYISRGRNFRALAKSRTKGSNKKELEVCSAHTFTILFSWMLIFLVILSSHVVIIPKLSSLCIQLCPAGV